ncbi:MULTISPECIES: MarR family transcriptional regulator [Amycolatopsis]|uniref:MarR family winged helix-turn-helix transcriptional regulator n=1 Tax=Amycolatopsis dongchuanensis TaxID=1070866 RepID=A0ABP9PW44_9PSEU
MPAAADQEVDDAVRALLLLMPRLVGRAEEDPGAGVAALVRAGPRHLSLLSYLLVGDLNRKGILERTEDEADRRRRIIRIAPDQEPAIRAWLARGAAAWRKVLTPLTPEQRRLFVDTLLAYEAAAGSSAGTAE